MKRKLISVGMCFLLTLSSIVSPSNVNATPLAPFIDLQERGLTLAADGEGLQGWDGSVRNLTVTVNGAVRFAVLYWNGSTACDADPCTFAQPFKDQQMLFNGTAITGTVIGTEDQTFMSGNPRLHIGYFADVTSLVSAAGTGTHSFTFADGSPASNLDVLNGVSLIVAYTNDSDMNFYRVLIWDGMDFAAATSYAAGDNRTAQAVTFNHGADALARQAELYVVNGGSTAALPDSVTVSNNPTISNSLDSSSGNLWDSDLHTIPIPANVGTTTVQLNSILTGNATPSGCGPGFWKNYPEEWAPTGYSPAQTVGSVFSAASAFPSLSSQTLLQTLQGGGGSGTLGAARILLRASVAALLSASHPELNYPRTPSSIIADVNAALASNNRTTMLDLASALSADNSLQCAFNAGEPASDTIGWQVAALRVPINDATAPTCTLTLNLPGPPARTETTIQDTGSGLAEILVTLSVNADTVVPPYMIGTTGPVVTNSTKIDQTQAASIEIRVTDLAGNVDICSTNF